MTGRPPRSFDDQLTSAVNRHLDESGGSIRSLAAACGVSPSTLSRSMAAGAFSKELGTRLRGVIGNTGESPAELMVHKALRLIELDRRMLKRSEAALRSALAHLASRQ